MIALNERQLPREFEVIATFARDQADHIDGRAVLDRHPFGLAAYIDQRMLKMQGRDLADPGVFDIVDRGEDSGVVFVGEIGNAVVERRHGPIEWDIDAQLLNAGLLDAVRIVVSNAFAASPALRDGVRSRGVMRDQISDDVGDDATEIEIEGLELSDIRRHLHDLVDLDRVEPASTADATDYGSSAHR